MAQEFRVSAEETYHRARSVEELTRRNVETIARLEQAAQAERGPGERLAGAITRFCGSMPFLYVHTLWFGFWLLWNGIPSVPKKMRFDPYPYELLTMVVSLEAIFLSTFVLISQNQQARLDSRRNQLDLQINLLSEQENSKMLAMLDKIAARLGIEADDPDVPILEEATRPETMLEQIREVMENDASVATAAAKEST